jgi:hypothetical protein
LMRLPGLISLKCSANSGKPHLPHPPTYPTNICRFQIWLAVFQIRNIFNWIQIFSLISGPYGSGSGSLPLPPSLILVEQLYYKFWCAQKHTGCYITCLNLNLQIG